jgi:hypothetical protein
MQRAAAAVVRDERRRRAKFTRPQSRASRGTISAPDDRRRGAQWRGENGRSIRIPSHINREQIADLRKYFPQLA